MSQLQAILHYQTIDTKLYKLERALAGCEERKEYMMLKKFLETAPEKLDALEVKAVAFKTEATELAKKYASIEKGLKDFENLDELVTGGADIAFYKKNVQAIVEQLKKVKAELATLTANIKATDEEFKKLKKQVISAQKQYTEAAEKYKAVKTLHEGEKKEIEAELETIAKDIPTDLLDVYKMKRKERVFPVVGELVGNRCPFCSMEPPLAARNQLTNGGKIECDNCHRLIFGGQS